VALIGQFVRAILINFGRKSPWRFLMVKSQKNLVRDFGDLLKIASLCDFRPKIA